MAVLVSEVFARSRRALSLANGVEPSRCWPLAVRLSWCFGSGCLGRSCCCLPARSGEASTDGAGLRR